MEWRLPIMGKQAKRAYLEAIRWRYLKTDLAGKARILDEFCCAVCGYHRKYAIRLLGCKKSIAPPRLVGRKPKYDDPLLLQALRRIWLTAATRNATTRPKRLTAGSWRLRRGQFRPSSALRCNTTRSIPLNSSSTD